MASILSTTSLIDEMDVLVMLGFSRSRASRALRCSDGTLNAALDFLAGSEQGTSQTNEIDADEKLPATVQHTSPLDRGYSPEYVEEIEDQENGGSVDLARTSQGSKSPLQSHCTGEAETETVGHEAERCPLGTSPEREENSSNIGSEIQSVASRYTTRGGGTLREEEIIILPVADVVLAEEESEGQDQRTGQSGRGESVVVATPALLVQVRCMKVLIASVLVGLVTIGVVLGLVLKKDGKNGTNILPSTFQQDDDLPPPTDPWDGLPSTSQPGCPPRTQAPTHSASPNTTDSSYNVSTFKDLLCERLTGSCDDLSNKDTPQAKALSWTELDLKFGSYEENQQIQRYVLAVVYFSMKGWGTGSMMVDWMKGPGNECRWSEGDENRIIECDNKGRVTYLNTDTFYGAGVKLPREVALLADSLCESVSFNKRKHIRCIFDFILDYPSLVILSSLCHLSVNAYLSPLTQLPLLIYFQRR